MRNSACRTASLVLSLILPCILCAQTTGGEVKPVVYIIRSVDFDVKGQTIPFVLRQKIEQDGVFVGREFPTKESLEAFIEEKRIVLANNRVLESVESSYTTTEEAEGIVGVSVVYTVVDTWNIMAFPIPEYSSDDGFELYIKAKDYNFLGSMESLTLNVSYVYDERGDQSFALYTAFDYPFKALGLEWSLGVTEDFEVWFAEGMAASTTSASLTLNIPDLGFPASVSLSQGFHYNEDELTTGESDPLFLSNNLSFNASIPTDLTLGALGPISYGFSAALEGNWWPGGTLEVDGRQGLSLTHSDSLSSGRIDWVGNTRTGQSVAVSSTQRIHMDSSSLTWDVSLTYQLFLPFWEGRAGLASRAVALLRPDTRAGNPIDSVDDYLRGVRDGRVNCEAALIANIAAPVKLFDFPTHVFIKKDWLDFELQAQPFVDLALAVPDWSSLRPTEDWIWAAGGLELLVFPKRFRSIIVRTGAGWDLLSVLSTKSLTEPSPRDGSSPYEIYFTTGLHY